MGAGLIVENAHLPAYAKAGLEVRALFDQLPERAGRLAAAWGIEREPDLDALLCRADVDVIDIAVTPHAQVAIAERALRAGKHVLAQKPLAPTVAQAEHLVQAADECGRLLAVNQQMRWAPTVRAMKERIDSGWLGRPLLLTYRLNLAGDVPAEHWLAREERYMASYGTIHYLDTARHLLGEPAKVTARLVREPGQNAVGETFVNAWVEWPDGALMVIFERYSSRSGTDAVDLLLEGTKGSVRGRLGIYTDYPHPAPDLVEARSLEGPWSVVSDDEYWLPDAFAGPMTGLIEAVESGDPPPTSARDNLATLRLVDALYRSDEAGAAVEV